MGKTQFVGPHPNGGWKVKGANNEKATKLFDTKSDAIAFGKQVAKHQQSELIIQGLNGKIQSKDSYGNDPCPPRDKEH